jgi:hypothetical protein
MVDNETIQSWIFWYAVMIEFGKKKVRNLFKVKRIEKILILQESIIAK